MLFNFLIFFWRFLSVVFPKGEKLAKSGGGREEKTKRKGSRTFLGKKIGSSF